MEPSITLGSLQMGIRQKLWNFCKILDSHRNTGISPNSSKSLQNHGTRPKPWDPSETLGSPQLSRNTLNPWDPSRCLKASKTLVSLLNPEILQNSLKLPTYSPYCKNKSKNELLCINSKLTISLYIYLFNYL